jgi:hypothetical protein
MGSRVLADFEWRAYESELVGQFLGADFDVTNPPYVDALLERDHIPPQEPEAARKVDRLAPAGAAGAIISPHVVQGTGVDAQFTGLDRRDPGPTRTICDTIGIEVRQRWIDVAGPLREDPTSRLEDYLRIYDHRTLSKPLPPDRVVTAHHIATGGQLALEVGGFLGALAGIVGGIENEKERLEVCHSLVPVEIGRATVHMATVDYVTPRWMTVPKIQLDRRRVGATLRDKNNERLWRGGGKPANTVTPRLECPIHRFGLLAEIAHAAINEGFARGTL